MRFIGRLLRNVRAGTEKVFHKRFTAPQSIVLDSPAFADGTAMPRKYLGARLGENISPALIWSGAPKATKSFALIIEDVDVPVPVPAVHGVAYFEAGRLLALSENVLSKTPPAQLTVGRNSLGRAIYAGPAPIPGHGPHRYIFQIFAIDRTLPLAPGFTRRALAAALEGRVLAFGVLTGLCER